MLPETGQWTNQVFERLCHSSGRLENHHAKLLPNSTMMHLKNTRGQKNEAWVHVCLVWRSVASVRTP